MTLLQGVYYALGALALMVFLSVMVLVITWVERKALARIQMRMGPMRVGFHGTFQPIADAVKLLVKEDILRRGPTGGSTGWPPSLSSCRRSFCG